MKYSVFASLLVAALSCLPVSAQAPAAKVTPAAAKEAATASAKTNWTPPKTSWGDPDLQGQWPATANIPMQRPVNLGDRAELTDAELAQRESQAKKQAAEDGEEVAKGTDVTINPPSYWVERGKPVRQASLVVDPPDGRIPPLTPEGRRRCRRSAADSAPAAISRTRSTLRRISTFTAAASRAAWFRSMLPTLYNFGNEIIQAPGYVLIRNEMIHETRVIPLDGRPHVGKGIRTYMGDSRGHWDGNTLVVETTNLKAKPGAGGGLFSDAAVLTERFTRTSPNDLSYDLTVNDPKTWTRPWSLHMPYKLDPKYKIYEYACHEGNYMMLDALSGARDLEKKGQSTKVDR